MSRLIVVFALLCSRLGDDNRAFDCTVRTDVNPSPIDVVVPAQQTVVVLTFRGSPARVFTPIVTCSK